MKLIIIALRNLNRQKKRSFLLGGAIALGSIHGGIPDIVEHEQTGFLVNEKDVQGISGTLGMLAAHPETRQRVGKAGREKMKRELEISVRAQILEHHYDEVIEEFQARRG